MKRKILAVLSLICVGFIMSAYHIYVNYTEPKTIKVKQ